MAALVNFEKQLTVSLAAYGIGDVLGLNQPINIQFSGAGKRTNIGQIQIVDTSDQKADIRLHFFKSKPAGTFTDNAAFSMSAANSKLVIASIDVAAADYTVDYGSQSIAKKDVTNLGDVRYVILESRATPTYAAADALLLRLVQS